MRQRNIIQVQSPSLQSVTSTLLPVMQSWRQQRKCFPQKLLGGHGGRCNSVSSHGAHFPSRRRDDGCTLLLSAEPMQTGNELNLQLLAQRKEKKINPRRQISDQTVGRCVSMVIFVPVHPCVSTVEEKPWCVCPLQLFAMQICFSNWWTDQGLDTIFACMQRFLHNEQNGFD